MPALPLPDSVDRLKQRSWKQYRTGSMQKQGIPGVYIFGSNHADPACAHALSTVWHKLKPGVVAVELRHKHCMEHRDAALYLSPLLEQLIVRPLTTHQLLAARLANLAMSEATARALEGLGFARKALWVRMAGAPQGLELSMALHLGAKHNVPVHFADDEDVFELTHTAVANVQREHTERSTWGEAMEGECQSLPDEKRPEFQAAAVDLLAYRVAGDAQVAQLQKLADAGASLPGNNLAWVVQELGEAYSMAHPRHLAQYMWPQGTMPVFKPGSSTDKTLREAMHLRDAAMAKAILLVQLQRIEAGDQPGPVLAVVGQAHVLGVFEQMQKLGPQLLPQLYPSKPAGAESHEQQQLLSRRRKQELEAAKAALRKAQLLEQEKQRSRERLQRAWETDTLSATTSLWDMTMSKRRR